MITNSEYMPIVVTLDVMLARRKMTLTELCEKLDLTMANVSILKTGKARGIRFKTLYGICKALDCQPADILVAMSNKEYEKQFGKKYQEE